MTKHLQISNKLFQCITCAYDSCYHWCDITTYCYSS